MKQYCNFNFILSSFVCAICILVISSCNSNVPDDTTKSTGTSSRHNTATAIPTVSVTEEVFLITPTFYQDISITPSTTPTSIQTLTPLPTLEPIVQGNVIQRLLRDNGECEPPCVWGMIPGKTSWHEAKQFLDTFCEYYGQGEGNPTSGTIFGYLFNVPDLNIQSAIDVSVIQYQVEGFSLFPPATVERYLLNQVLSRYGEPDEVFVTAYPDSPIGKPPFVIILYYSKLGFSALYEFVASNLGSQLTVCPYENQVGPRIEIWNPKKPLLSGQLFADYFEGEIPILPIDQAAGLSIIEFTDRFSSGNVGECIHTAVDIWYGN